MNRSNRTGQQNSRGLVSGEVYDPPHQQQQQQQEQQQENYQNDEIEEVEMKPETSNAAQRVDELLENGKFQFKKIFQKRKKSSERARQKKIRQNRQLRKAMLPKNALTALNELKGVVISDFIVNDNAGGGGGGFRAVVTVNNVQYEGIGSSKMSSKNNACEKALRDIIIAKMAAKPKKSTAVVAAAAASPTKGAVAELAEAMDTTEDDAQSEPEDEDVPMISLASFAIFKLFSDWEKEGFFVPEMHPGSDTSQNAATSAAKKSKKKLSIRNELPPNWETMHPVSLLFMMRPGVNYIDFGQVGEMPNVLQRLGVNVDGKDFVAEGRSKKIARRNVAVNVCNTLFGTNFSVFGEGAYI